MKFVNLAKQVFKGVVIMSVFSLMVACGGNDASETKNNLSSKLDEESSSMPINVISREQGSGTRGAFTEITGLLAKNDKGEKTDNTSVEAVIQNSTDGVMTAVSNDTSAIGYISLGSLNDTVKAVSVEGIAPSAAKVKSGEYKIARPFNIVYQGTIGEEAKDFLSYLDSKEAQKIVEAAGYVSIDSSENYEGINNKAHLTIAGSTSVSPLMEKLVEDYTKFNPDFVADIQSNGSSAGVKAVQEGAAEIGMVSRELKDSEQGIEKEVIAMDGIAVIVNKELTLENLSLEEVKNIFEGKVTNWDEFDGK